MVLQYCHLQVHLCTLTFDMPHTLLVTCRSVLFNVKTKYFYYFIYFIFIIFILFLYYFRCFFIVLVYCQGCGGFWVGSVGFWVVPARFRVVPAGSGGFCVGSAFYIHPAKMSLTISVRMAERTASERIRNG